MAKHKDRGHGHERGGGQPSQYNSYSTITTYEITPAYEPFGVIRLPRLYAHLLIRHPWQTILGTVGLLWAGTFAFYFVVNGISRNPALIVEGFDPSNPKHLATNLSAFAVPTVASTASNLQQVVYSDVAGGQGRAPQAQPLNSSNLTLIGAVSGRPTQPQPQIQFTELKY